MHIVVRSFGTRLVDTSVCQSAADLKCLLASEDGLPLEDIRLYSGTSILDSDTILADLPADCAIDVSVGVLGGTFSGCQYWITKTRSELQFQAYLIGYCLVAPTFFNLGNIFWRDPTPYLATHADVRSYICSLDQLL
ncbi:small subunit ribosomal protein s30e [Echinococcus multilocularis]|uniref:Small subunit ribosomal protein s30e n=1 Tax=Echinococcus multilocularis TaxID=6211 RepID=A0A068YF45_ECHMU|nr:small subunit ribosomal protein s30e [Echinococcus multilocularis]